MESSSLETETESVLEQMGVSRLTVVFLLSGCTNLFMCSSCKFRLQCEPLHSSLPVFRKSCPGWFVLSKNLAFSLITQQNICGRRRRVCLRLNLSVSLKILLCEVRGGRRVLTFGFLFLPVINLHLYKQTLQDFHPTDPLGLALFMCSTHSFSPTAQVCTVRGC